MIYFNLCGPIYPQTNCFYLTLIVVQVTKDVGVSCCVSFLLKLRAILIGFTIKIHAPTSVSFNIILYSGLCTELQPDSGGRNLWDYHNHSFECWLSHG